MALYTTWNYALLHRQCETSNWGKRKNAVKFAAVKDAGAGGDFFKVAVKRTLTLDDQIRLRGRDACRIFSPDSIFPGIVIENFGNEEDKAVALFRDLDIDGVL